MTQESKMREVISALWKDCPVVEMSHTDCGEPEMDLTPIAEYFYLAGATSQHEVMWMALEDIARHDDSEYTLEHRQCVKWARDALARLSGGGSMTTNQSMSETAREAFELERALVYDLKRGTGNPESYAEPKVAAEWRVFKEAWQAARKGLKESITRLKQDDSKHYNKALDDVLALLDMRDRALQSHLLTPEPLVKVGGR